MNDFALLGFASEAGFRILGRPANSLIGLDEVFDSIEVRLRAVDELKDAFAAYDLIERTVIAQRPVMERHAAKLVLKGLFLLSFNEEVVTAQELSAAMLIFDESTTDKASAHLESELQAFSDAAPELIRTTVDEGQTKRFGFRLSGKDELKSALAEEAQNVPLKVVESILLRQTADKFSDFHLSDDQESPSVDCEVKWRGGIRRGQVNFVSDNYDAPTASHDPFDWRVFVRFPAAAGVVQTIPVVGTDFEWRLGDLTADEIETIRRYNVLQTNTALREKFNDSLSAAIHFHSIAVEKIWQRIYFEDACLVSDRSEFRFSVDANSSTTLSQVLSTMLAAEFEARFPLHPHFGQVLGAIEVSRLTEYLFSGADTSDPEVQSIARNVALPLGLVYEFDDAVLPLSAEALSALPLIQDVFDVPAEDQSEVIPLGTLSKRMQNEPYGLSAEAQHLVLVSLISQRRYEFVTSSGNRINHRSLDLQIVWNDIVGIAPPLGEEYSTERLLRWAILFTGNTSLKSINTGDAKTKLARDLGDWLGTWQNGAVLIRFDQLPDEKLNSELWRMASNVKKTFGVLALSIESVCQNELSIHDCLQSIAGVFCDSEEEFEKKKSELKFLLEFVDGFEADRVMHRYLVDCDPTRDEVVERLRMTLMDALVSNAGFTQDSDKVGMTADWIQFKSSYSSRYAEAHDSAMSTSENRKILDEFLQSDLWSTFTEISSIPFFGRAHMESALALVREIRNMACECDVKQILETQPHCICGFSLVNKKTVNDIIGELNMIVTSALNLFREKLVFHKRLVFDGLHTFTVRNGENSLPIEAGSLIKFIEEGTDEPRFSGSEVQFLKNITAGPSGSEQLFGDGSQVPFETLSDLLLENELDRLREVG